MRDEDVLADFLNSLFNQKAEEKGGVMKGCNDFAKFNSCLLDALRHNGFTREESMDIIKALIPSIFGGSK